MRAEILSVGTELLLGQLVDTNAPWLAQSLSTIGVDVFWISQVGDNQDRMVQALRHGWERSDLIVISGGVGPTGDDLTRESIAELLGEEMVVHPELEVELRAFFSRRNRPMPERNVKQATLIPSATAIPNPIGSAPGWWVEKDKHIIVAMPGVPVEMKRMWENEVLPKLIERAGSGIIFSRTLKVLGLGESSVEDQLKELIPSPNPTVATYAKNDGVHVRVTAKAPDKATASALVADYEARVRLIIGEFVYGVDEETIADAVGALLRQTGLTLSTLEAGTAGQLSAALASATVGTECILGSQVAHNAELLAQFGVSQSTISAHGLVSEEVARQMASAARESMNAKLGLASVCGMEGNSPNGQPQGVVYSAVDNQGQITSVVSRYWTIEREVRRRAVMDAMDLLRRGALLR